MSVEDPEVCELTEQENGWDIQAKQLGETDVTVTYQLYKPSEERVNQRKKEKQKLIRSIFLSNVIYIIWKSRQRTEITVCFPEARSR